MSPGQGSAGTADQAESDVEVFPVDVEDGTRREYRLATHFQPIFSLAHRRPVGYEALIRGTDVTGKVYLPAELLAQAPAGVARMHLDRQCRSLHVRNFQRLRDELSWLFLNVDPHIAVRGRRFGSFAQMLEERGLSPRRVAVELIETPFDDQKRLVKAVEHYHELGCLVVIDDFGAGYSNFDRIWQLKPDIVKIDREMTRRVTVEPLARRMFGGIISVLHEAGALVCVEGIETEGEALCATEANADLLQGNFFAPPAVRPPADNACDEIFIRLFAQFRDGSNEFGNRRRARLQPYLAAFSDAVLALSVGADRANAVRALLELQCTERCYLVAADGSQIGASAESERSAAARDPRLVPIRPITGTNWQTKPFFRRAMEAPGKIQITRPYLSATGPRLCVTLSYALLLNGLYHVLCVDLDFAALAGEDLAFGLARLEE
ncbi:MAG TPA: EAL domain-containing protein [Burkholderiales bacterium]|nr:EAL domain-containing protein [Burkholderiales bacterium]